MSMNLHCNKYPIIKKSLENGIYCYSYYIEYSHINLRNPSINDLKTGHMF